MSAYKSAGLPLDRLMVGTGAAATADAVALTRHAAELGFAGALVLPPFYYKGVPDDGLAAYIDTIVKATAAEADPDLSLSLPVAVRPALARRADRAAARALRRPHRRPEGFLRRHGLCARGRRRSRRASTCSPRPKPCCSRRARGAFAGCISATANLNADLCQRAWATGDTAALDAAVTIRKLFDGKPLVSGVKAMLAHIHGDPALARVKPPLAPFSAADRAGAVAGYDQVRGKRVA